MNYSDFDEIIEDEFTGSLFGKESQIEILGWSGRRGTQKRYIVLCHYCKEDRELFGDGVFRTSKSQLVTRGLQPCGCSSCPRWMEEQNRVRCERKARELGFTFIGWTSQYIGDKTKLIMSCETHGEWNTGTLNHLMNGRGCPGCKGSITANFNRKTKAKTEQHFIESFISTGAFSEGTTFTKISRKDKAGNSNYWKMTCPDCHESGEILGSDLQKGRRPCACTSQRQKQAYINSIYSETEIIAIKFGIAVLYSNRVTSQNSKSFYTVTNDYVYEFANVESCKRAESLCKQRMVCGILTKQQMPDGYTETTSKDNLRTIQSIYEECGGVLIRSPTHVLSN